MNSITSTRSSQLRRVRSTHGARASLVAAVMAVLFVVALPTGAAFAAPGPIDIAAAPATVTPQNSGPDDLVLCTEDCGPDEDPPTGPDDLVLCTEDCGPDEDPPTGPDDGADTKDDDIPVPTRIDTGDAPADPDAAHGSWVIAAVSAALGLSALTYRALRVQR